MNITKLFFNTKTTSGVFGVGLCVLGAQPCVAQSAACVNLLVKAGYVAWMGVHFGESYHWSSSFPIGQSRCIKLPVSGMVNGAPYTVVVSAAAGKSKVLCTPDPSPYSSSDTNTVSYNAWGATWSVTCKMPSPENFGTDEPITPSKEGLESLENWKKDKSKPAAE